MTGWAIYDEEKRRRYILRDYETREEAERELLDLLSPYPKNHMWRDRLRLRYMRTKVTNEDESRIKRRTGS